MFNLSFNLGILMTSNNIKIDEIFNFLGIKSEQLMPSSRKKWEMYAANIDDAIWKGDRSTLRDYKLTLYDFIKGKAELAAPFTNGDLIAQICLLTVINKYFSNKSNDQCIENALRQMVQNRKLKDDELKEAFLFKLGIEQDLTCLTESKSVVLF